MTFPGEDLPANRATGSKDSFLSKAVNLYTAELGATGSAVFLRPKELMMTTGRILLDLADLQTQTMHIIGRTSTAVRQFDILAATIRRENDQRLRAITQSAEAVNGTTTPPGASDFDEYTKAHAAERINDARAINKESH